MIPKPGIYHGVPFAEYLEWEAASKSKLFAMRRTPRHSTVQQPPTDAMDFGSLVHTLLLEPENFEALYAVGPDVDTRASKEWKAWAVCQSAPNLLKPGEMKAALAAEAVALSKPAVAALLDAEGDAEVSFVWNCPETGVLCKGRADKWLPGESIALDVKTTTDASTDAFRRTVLNFGYHYQAAHYLHGMIACGLRPRRFIHLVIESKAPFECKLYELDEAWLEVARLELPAMLRLYDECTRSGIWPGYDEEIEPLDAPEWLVDRALVFGLSA